MKKIKLALWVAALAVLALMIIQNRDFFMSDPVLHLNLYFSQYQLPEWPVAVIFLCVFIFGCLLTSLSVLGDRIKSGLRIKRLNKALDECSKKIADIQNVTGPDNRPEKSKSLAFWRSKSRNQDHQSIAGSPTVSVNPDGYLKISALHEGEVTG
jgi:uncharacterized integral membrane protein